MPRGSPSTIFTEAAVKVIGDDSMEARLRKVLITLLLASAAAALAACASGASGGQAAQWIMENEAEKQRLNDAGFPQYVGSA